MYSRKEFIRTGSMGLLGLFLNRPESKASSTPDNIRIEENVNWDEIRTMFDFEPDITFLNNGTMGPSPRSVINAVHKRMVKINATGRYGGGDKECVQAIAGLVGADTDEIALTHNVTEGINIAAWGLPLKKGDEVLISDHEHVGNAAPWLNLRRLKGIRIKVVPLGRNAEQTLKNVKKAVTKKTRVIAIPHIPCTIGQVVPVNEMCAWARSRNIYTVVDGAHGTGMLNLNLHEMQCDVYLSCCHKWLLGPKGTGYMYVRKELIKELESLHTGGYSALDWELSVKSVSFKGVIDNAHRYYYGTQSSPLYYGVIEAVNFHQSLGVERIENRVKELNDVLFEQVKGIKGINVLTPEEKESRAGVLSIKFKKKDNREFYDNCYANGMILRYVGENDLYCIRISTHIYNSESQVDQVVKQIHLHAKS